MERPRRRRGVSDLGPVRAGGEQERHHDRHGGDQRGAHSRRDERLDACAHADERMFAREPIRQHETGQHVERQQRDLVAVDRNQPGQRPGGESCPPRRSLERTRSQPQRQRKIGEADDLRGVLDARIGRAAERKCERRHQRAARMPAAIAEEQDDSDAAQEQIDEGHGIEGAQADRWTDRRQGDMKRREQQRLRIGNLRPPGEDVGRPPRPFAARNRVCEELHLRKELRLRIPRDGDRPGKPRPGRKQEPEREERDRNRQRNAGGREHGCGRWSRRADDPRRQVMHARRLHRRTPPRRDLAVRRHRRVVPQVHSLVRLVRRTLGATYCALRAIRKDVAPERDACPRWIVAPTSPIIALERIGTPRP